MYFSAQDAFDNILHADFQHKCEIKSSNVKFIKPARPLYQQTDLPENRHCLTSFKHLTPEHKTAFNRQGHLHDLVTNNGRNMPCITVNHP
jgi:hypothetical protein